MSVLFLFQYLKIVRHLDGYGEITFPHCPCDSRKDGHVIAVVGIECFKLQACKDDGTPEVSFIRSGSENRFVFIKMTIPLWKLGTVCS